MPPPIKPQKAASSLKQKGFMEEKKQKGRKGQKDHIYYHHEFHGKVTGISTKISHSSGDISGDLLTKMKKQLNLDSNQDAYDFLACPMDMQRYNEILIQKHVFSPDQQ